MALNASSGTTTLNTTQENVPASALGSTASSTAMEVSSSGTATGGSLMGESDTSSGNRTQGKRVTFDLETISKDDLMRAFLAERQARLEAEQRILAEQAARLEAEASNAANRMTVRECIQGKPMYSTLFIPRWGERPMTTTKSGKPIKMSSTATPTSGHWLRIGPDDVEEMRESELIEYLEGADTVTVVDGSGNRVALLPLVMEGRADYLEYRLNGEAAERQRRDQLTYEAEVHRLVSTLLDSQLESVMGGDLCLETNAYCPSRGLVSTRVEFQHGSQLFGIPPHLYGLVKPNRAYETRFERRAFPKDGWFEKELGPEATEEEKRERDVEETRSLVKDCSVILGDVKVDWKAWKARDESKPASDEFYNADLVKYMRSEYFDPVKSNPVAQSATYACSMRSRLFIIHTGNHFTFGFIDEKNVAAEEHPSSTPYPNPKIRLTKRFFCDETKPLATRDWSLWEVVIRLLIASRERWCMTEVPYALKQLLSKNVANEQRRRAASGSSAPPRLDFLSYADLWDPCRFAIPATVPVEVEFSQRDLNGDAEVIGWGRSGPAYRKTIQGLDLVVKLAFVTGEKKDFKEDPDAGELRAEMRREFEVYEELERLQGEVIPQLVWHGELVPGAVVATAMIFCGEELPETPSEEQKRGAMRALQALHDNGVLHRDAVPRNFVVRKEDGKIFVLDFGFSVFKREIETEEEWERRTTEEMNKLKAKLGWREEEVQGATGTEKLPVVGMKRKFDECV